VKNKKNKKLISAREASVMYSIINLTINFIYDIIILASV